MNQDEAIQILRNVQDVSGIFGIGSKGDKVSALQFLLLLIDRKLYSGKVDGDFGKLTFSAVTNYQQLRLLDEDGLVGPLTIDDLIKAVGLNWNPGALFDHPSFSIKTYGVYHPNLGYLPDLVLGEQENGKVSQFGGPDDKWDRIYGQAYIRGANSPKELHLKQRQLFQMGVLREEVISLNEYPMVTDWKERKKQAGTSWCLNIDSFYIAMRWRVAGRNMGYLDHRNPRLLVWSEKTNKAVVCLRTDYGPSTRAGRLMDLSKGALDYIGLKTDDRARVCWAFDKAEIGPVK